MCKAFLALLQLAAIAYELLSHRPTQIPGPNPEARAGGAYRPGGRRASSVEGSRHRGREGLGS